MKALEIKQNHMGGEFIVKYFTNVKWKECDLTEIIVENFKEVSSVENFKEVSRIENLLTEFGNSPFNEINRQVGQKAVQVDAEIFKIIEYSISLSEETFGAFDISWASIGHLWRENDFQEEKLNAAKEWVDYKKIVLDKRSELSIYHQTRCV